jgi:transposase-like protein
MTKPEGPVRYFNSSPEVIRLVVPMYVRFLLSPRNVEDLLFERGIDPLRLADIDRGCDFKPAPRRRQQSSRRSQPRG